MKKTEPYNPGENNTYKDADLARQIKGSIPKAEFFNQVEQELLNIIIAAGMTPSGEDLDQAATAIQRIVNGGIRYQSLYQKLKPVTGGNVVLDDEKIIGWAEVSAETTFNFDCSNVSKKAAGDIITFELYVNMPEPVVINWPAIITETPPTEEGGEPTITTTPLVEWGDDNAPDMSDPGLYLLTFRSLDHGETWEGSVQCMFKAILPPTPETEEA